MKRLMNIVFSMSAILALGAQSARGQQRAGEGTWGFVNVRHDTRSTSVYAGYGWQAAFVMAGLAHNPRTGHGELIGGVGAVVRTRTSEHWIALATAGTDAGSVGQIYWLPTIRVRSLTTRAQVKWTAADGERTAQKLSISPLSLTLPLGRWLSGGVATEITAADGARTRIGAGLELRVRLPGAAVGVDALRAVQGDASRLRFFFASLL